MKIINESDVPTKLIAAIVRFTRPPGIRKFYVKVKGLKWGRGDYKGQGSGKGITVWVNMKAKYPSKLWTYPYGQLKRKYKKDRYGFKRQVKGRRYWLESATEALLYVIAHELMHVKQGQRGNCRGRVWGARGRFSEIETESYAIRKLRDYRQSK
jgi:hypothetical protein